MPILTPPSAETGTYGDRGLWRFFTFAEGLAIVKTNGAWSLESVVLVDDAEEFYFGGMTHVISDATADELTNAGFGAYITGETDPNPPDDPPGYGEGGYGEGAYGY